MNTAAPRPTGTRRRFFLVNSLTSDDAPGGEDGQLTGTGENRRGAFEGRVGAETYHMGGGTVAKRYRAIVRPVTRRLQLFNRLRGTLCTAEGCHLNREPVAADQVSRQLRFACWRLLRCA